MTERKAIALYPPSVVGNDAQIKVPPTGDTYLLDKDTRIGGNLTVTGTITAVTGAADKTTPVDADRVAVFDSADNSVLKKVTWANTKATLKAYFDTLYVGLTGNQTIAGAKTWTGLNTFSGSAEGIYITHTDDSAAVGPGCSLYRYSASPTAFDNLGSFRFLGNDTGGGDDIYAQIRAQIVDPTASSEDGQLLMQTNVAGTVTTCAAFRTGLVVGSPTGGDKGAGTINAVAVYDDNSILTDYVFDAAIDGSVDIEKWDNAVPNRRNERGEEEVRVHEPARRFAQNLDELEPEAFDAKVQATRKLPAFDRIGADPSVGKALQALIETCEVQAIHIKKLTARIAALESSR